MKYMNREQIEVLTKVNIILFSTNYHNLLGLTKIINSEKMNQKEKNLDHLPHIEFRRIIVNILKVYTNLKNIHHFSQLEECRNKLKLKKT